MLDPFDRKAQLIGIYIDNQPIASARVLCLDPEEEWEHDRFFAWPGQLPPRFECAEISRFCIVRQHRSWPVMQALCHAIAAAMLNTRRRYIVACCTDQLVSFYKKFFDASFVNITFTHVDLGSEPHHLFFSDFREGMLGRSLELLPWLSLWPRPTLVGLLNGGLVHDAGPLARVWLFVKLLIGVPLSPSMGLIAQKIRRSQR